MEGVVEFIYFRFNLIMPVTLIFYFVSLLAFAGDGAFFFLFLFLFLFFFFFFFYCLFVLFFYFYFVVVAYVGWLSFQHNLLIC